VTRGEELVRLTCDDVKVAAGLADVNFRRAERLFKAGTLSPDAMDRVRSAKDESDVRLGWCSIASPLNGEVLSRYREPGELVGPGAKLLTLADVKDIWAYIYVPQPEVSRLKPGMALTGYLPELGMKPFQGRILKINAEAEFTPKNVQTRSERERLVFGVKVGFRGANDDETLKPGMTIEVALPK
jgi:HlyD family secretion protein